MSFIESFLICVSGGRGARAFYALAKTEKGISTVKEAGGKNLRLDRACCSCRKYSTVRPTNGCLCGTGRSSRGKFFWAGYPFSLLGKWSAGQCFGR